ncbi:ion channel [Nakamurella alba]|nr:ion channel [Nakamurella alba]
MARWTPPAVFDNRSRHVDRFGTLLALTATSVVCLSLFGVDSLSDGLLPRLGGLAVTVSVGATLLLSLRAAGVALVWIRIADVVVGLSVALSLTLVVLGLVHTASPADANPTAAPVVWLVLSLAATVVVVARLLRHREVTLRTVQGAISAYLLISVSYYYLFRTVHDLQDGFFRTPANPPEFMYFSLSNLATLGIGDLVPRSRLARLLTVSEAVVGQVFLVTFVALIVGLLAERWRRRGDIAP